MAIETEKLKLYKKDLLTDGDDKFNITTMLNDNWDKIDEFAEDVVVSQAGKANINAANFTPEGESYLSGLAAPGNVFDEYSLPTTDSTLTAPANGYFSFSCTGDINTDAHLIGIYNDLKGGIRSQYYAKYTFKMKIMLPVMKDEVVIIEHLGIQASTASLKFIYAKGATNDNIL